jgi:glycine/D-amino acid oxidase-like deaminating enzyme
MREAHFPTSYPPWCGGTAPDKRVLCRSGASRIFPHHTLYGAALSHHRGCDVGQAQSAVPYIISPIHGAALPRQTGRVWCGPGAEYSSPHHIPYPWCGGTAPDRESGVDQVLRAFSHITPAMARLCRTIAALSHQIGRVWCGPGAERSSPHHISYPWCSFAVLGMESVV